MKLVNKKSLKLINIFEKFNFYIGLGVLILLIFTLIGGISKLKTAGLEIDKEEEKLNKLEQENEELRKNLEIVKSEEFVEKQLRDKLGLVKDGEIVVILPDEELVKKFAPRIDEEEEILADPNWRKWMKLFGVLE